MMKLARLEISQKVKNVLICHLNFFKVKFLFENNIFIKKKRVIKIFKKIMHKKTLRKKDLKYIKDLFVLGVRFSQSS